MDLVIRGATVLTLDARRRVLPRASVLVREGRIEQVGEVSTSGLTEVVDGSGCFLLPGLVQAHLHLCQTLFRGQADGLDLLDWLRQRIWPLEASHDERSMEASVELGLCELIRGGTTAALDMGSVRHQDVVFEVAARAGFRLTSGKAHMDAGQAIPAPLRERTEASLAEGEALCRRWHDKGLSRYAFAPRFLLTCSDGLLREIAGLARGLQARLHSHAGESVPEGEAVRQRFGTDAVEVLQQHALTGSDVALAHGVWLTARERRILADSGTHLVHCPSSNLKLGSGIAHLVELRDAGVRLSLGCDGAACSDRLDALAEARLALLLHRPRSGPAALSAVEILEMATMGGARALGLEDRIGSIEPGKRADLLLLDARGVGGVPGDPDPHGTVVNALGREDVRSVWIDGRCVLHDGELRTLDAEQAVARALEQGERLVKKGLGGPP